MADRKMFIDRSTLVAIADAIRSKKGTTALIPVSELADEILSIAGGGEIIIPEGYIKPEGNLDITENGTYDVTDKASVTVAVEAEDKAKPIEVSTEAEMTALLTSGEVGGVYKYTGTTGTYENGALYVLEEETAEEETATLTITYSDSPYNNLVLKVTHTDTGDTLGTLNEGETKTFTVDKGTSISLWGEGTMVSAWNSVSNTGECEIFGNIPGYHIKVNGDCTIVGYPYEDA